MKFLLLLTSVIAVFTADYRGIPGKPGRETDRPTGFYNSADQNEHFPDELIGSNSAEETHNIHSGPDVRSVSEEAENFPAEPVDRDFTDEDQESIEGPIFFTDGPPSLGSSEIDQHYMKERKGRNGMELRGKKQDKVLKELSKNLETFKNIMTHAYSELKVELASIKEHQTNITNIGTSLKEEQHYIRDQQYNITGIVTEFKEELHSFKDHQDNNTAELHPVLANITDSNLKLKTEVNSMTQNITDSNLKLKTEVNSMTQNITDSNLKLKTEVNSMTQNITDSISKLKTEVHSMKLNMNNTISLIMSKLDSIKSTRGCPTGFFMMTTPILQCLKVFEDQMRNWTDANAKCLKEGLALVQPYDPVALRNFMITKYGPSSPAWLGARGTGSTFKWQRDGVELSKDLSVWWTNHPGTSVSSRYCLWLSSYASEAKKYPNQAYFAQTCTRTAYSVCELVS